METSLIKKPLYQIRQEHLELIDKIEEADGILTEETELALQLNEQEFESKATSYAFIVKSFENTEEIIDKEIKRLQEFKDKAHKRQEIFKRALSEAMQEFGYEKIETPTLRLSFRKSEAVEITNDFAIPKEFIDVKITESFSKTKIKEAIKAGKVVPGAELVERKNLQIR